MRAPSSPGRNRPRVVVLGAGPGGLASAMLLAAAGADVTLLERRDRVGGRTSSFRGGGFTFDLGPTFFLYPQVLRSIFAMCGRSLDEEIELIRLDPHYRLVFEGSQALEVTADIERMKREIARFSTGDAANLERFMRDNRRKLAAFKPILESAFSGWSDLLRRDLLAALPLLRPWASVESDLGRHFEDPRVRMAFCFQSKYLGMSPFQCPSLFTILSFLEYEHGVFHPRGGCGAVSRAMARVAREMGVEIRLEEPVESIRFQGRRAVAVETPRGRHDFDALVVNADFADAMRRLVPDRLRRRWSDRRLQRKRFSCSTFMLYLGVEGDVPELPHHTIHLAADYETNLTDIERDHRLSRSPSFYVQNASVTDPSLAPRGSSALYVLVPVTHQHPNVDWRREAGPFRDLVLRQLAKVGLGGLERRIRWERVVTPDDWSAQRIHKGATFNLAHNLGQMLHLRPRNRFQELDGVYLVGGGTHPGSGLPVIYESARITARLMAEDLALSPRWDLSAAPESLPLEPELARSA